MKKVSTRAAAQRMNISQQKLTIGLELGDRNSWYCVVDEAGQIQLEQRVRTTAKALQEVFGAMPRSRIALEIGTHSPWISRMLSDLGHVPWRSCNNHRTFTRNSRRPHRHPPRRRRSPPRPPLLHLVLLEGGRQRILSRGVVSMFHP